MIDIQSLIARNRLGEDIGLPCFCTANEHVLRAILGYAAKTGFPVVIEATCNQVNQDGGYTGMTPADFMSWLLDLAKEANVPLSQLVVGSDHLGPNPWRAEPANVAMEKARELVKQYVLAGFQKIHLDASMPCGDETHLTFAQIAERAAALCAVAEAHAPYPEKLIYIIGTEVPIPGGETEEPDALDITTVARFNETIDTHKAAFEARGLGYVWPRIVSVVTQPGVDFGHTSIFPFDPSKAMPLKSAILQKENLTFEAHSTDYQPTEMLKALVQNQFFFLKVGPELTFRFREAIWALAEIETQIQPLTLSNIKNVIRSNMEQNPENWQSYYEGTDDEIERLKVYSYSDRIRYYWTNPKINASLHKLFENLSKHNVPETIISQAFMGLEFGQIPNSAEDLCNQHIQRCVSRYYKAAGFE